MADFEGARKVVKIAFLARAIGILIQCVSDNLIVDYDTSVEHYNCNISGVVARNNTFDKMIRVGLGGISKWDSVYFLDIAKHGYRFEQNMAFFPLLPLSLRTFSVPLRPLKRILNLSDESVLLLSSALLNTIAFAVAVLGLFSLTLVLFKSEKLARKVALLFCINPASVFFNVTYSESLFAMTQFWGMFFLERNKLHFAILLFSLGGGSRSNGMISCGFIVYKSLQELALMHCVSRDKENSLKFRIILKKLLKTFAFLLAVILPFVSFQIYGYFLFCMGSPHGRHVPAWCNDVIPLPYSSIQKRYWNVGFLKYYEMKQIPNFILATPVAVLSALGIREYLIRQRREDVLTVGFLMARKPKTLNIFVYAGHLAFLLLFGVTSMHVQVITRMILSSSPMIYWIAASWLEPSGLEEAKTRRNFKETFVFTYFTAYYCLGYLLHCNFYPWT